VTIESIPSDFAAMTAVWAASIVSMVPVMNPMMWSF
jgi:hypothetical protein